MKAQTRLVVYFVFLMPCLFSPLQAVHADLCDKMYESAQRIVDSASDAANQKKYDRAADLYREAARNFEKIERKTDCRCPKIPGAARENAARYRAKADRYEEAAKAYKADMRLYEQFNEAKRICMEGHALARKGEWEKAIAAFEEAAEIWEGLAGEYRGENSIRAAKAAEQARNAADTARQYQQRQ